MVISSIQSNITVLRNKFGRTKLYGCQYMAFMTKTNICSTTSIGIERIIV